MKTFEKWIEFLPAFDKRNPDPSKNFGIHGVEMRWYLRGEKGVIQFVVFTNWQLPHIREEQGSDWEPTGADFGYHAKEPQYEGQRASECRLLWGKCYYDGSSLYADKVLEKLIREGHEAAVWQEMEREYKSRFDGEGDVRLNAMEIVSEIKRGFQKDTP